MKFVTLLSTFLLSQGILAFSIGTGDVCGVNKITQDETERVCVCEVQAKRNSNAKEYPFYRAGCSNWLARQKCSVKKIVEEGDSIDDLLVGGEKSALIMGYVGHWSGSEESIRYLEERIEPIVKKHDVTVYYDNTACSGASDPVAMLNHLSELDPEVGKKIILKANENVSVGEWDGVLKLFVKSNAPVVTCSDAIQVQHCSRYQDKNCSLYLNHNSTMGCLDNGGVFKVLKCQKRRDNQSIAKVSFGKWRSLDISQRGTEVRTVSGVDVAKTIFPGGFFGSIDLVYIISETYEYEGEVRIEDYLDGSSHYDFITWDVFESQNTEGFAEMMRKKYEVSKEIPSRFLDNDLIETSFDHARVNGPAGHYYMNDLNSTLSFIDFGNANLNIIVSDDLDVLEYYKKNFNPISNYYRVGKHYRANKNTNRTLREYMQRKAGLL